MKKLLLITNQISNYRVVILNLLNEEFDFTVAFSDKNYKEKEYNFKTMYLPVKKIGLFERHIDGLHKIASDYDVVLGVFNIRWVDLMSLVFKRKRTYKLGYWGIGVTASYENKFDSKSTWDKIRYFVAKKSDFMIFYSSYPIKKYINNGVERQKLFVANNTTEVVRSVKKDNVKKEDFMFIGTLYKQKGINELLDSYYELYKKNSLCPKLNIIGDGEERSYVENFIKERSLSDKVILHGSIFNLNKISELYDSSIACFSPNQAGLSVLNSMGNETIFVTKKDAITGGEIFNIKNMVNGIIYTEKEELAGIMDWIINNKNEVYKMNFNAYEFYLKERQPEMMANSIKEAVNYSLNK